MDDVDKPISDGFSRLLRDVDEDPIDDGPVEDPAADLDDDGPFADRAEDLDDDALDDGLDDDDLAENPADGLADEFDAHADEVDEQAAESQNEAPMSVKAPKPTERDAAGVAQNFDVIAILLFGLAVIVALALLV